MRSPFIRGLLWTWLLVSPAVGLAHPSPPPRDCVTPTRPADDQNDELWQRFLDDVDAFRDCISRYVDANQAAARVHNEAARQATLEWNGFVRSTLNVPEDYPWPPEERGRGEP